jgi:5-hydroxyisourate hydrolase-like protein (transthyretin family)
MSSNLIERRDFLAMGLAFGTIAATAPPAFAQPAKEPKLTLHVLDVYSGKPAAKVRVDLSVLAGENYQHLKSVNTAASGRNEQPLLAGQEIKVGGYELLFYVADYYRGLEVKLPDPHSSTKCRYASQYLTQPRHITFRFWSPRGATPLIGAVEEAISAKSLTRPNHNEYG